MVFSRPSLDTDHGNSSLSLPDLIEFSAKHNANMTFALQDQAGDLGFLKITYAELQTAVENASAWLVSSGCTTGRTSRTVCVRPVAILLSSDITVFILMAALIRLGTPLLCLSARLSAVAIAHLLHETSTSTVLVGPQTAKNAQEAKVMLEANAGAAGLTFIQPPDYAYFIESMAPVSLPPKYTDYRCSDCDAIIMHSSGTTGLPKPIYHSHDYLLMYATCHELGPTSEPLGCMVSTLPLYHALGLLAPMLALSVGLPMVLLPASVIPTARTVVQALASSGAWTMLSVPSILEDILRLPNGIGLDALKKLKFVSVGGAPMKESVAQELLAHNIRISNHWGSTEIGDLTPFFPPAADYDWHWISPRTDLDLRFVPAEDGRTVRVVGRPPGWSEDFVVQDLLLPHPSIPNRFRILGRADDLLVLSTGEKVRPGPLVSAIEDHPSVKAVMAFGTGRASMGILVELVDGSTPPQDLWTYLEKGNTMMDGHGRVEKDMVVFTSMPMLRTDKGSLQVKATLALFEDEITRAYECAGRGGERFVGDVREILRGMVADVSRLEGYRSGVMDGVDFFEAGMDSLQASRLRRAISAGLYSTPKVPDNLVVESDLCFRFPTVDKLFDVVSKLLSGQADVKVTEDARIQAMEAMVETFAGRVGGFGVQLAREMCRREQRWPSKAVLPVPPSGRLLVNRLFDRLWALGETTRGLFSVRQGRKVVLLTGSTGSLGCFLLAKLLEDASVNQVICINRQRPGSENALDIQRRAMEQRGAVVEEKSWKRVKVIQHDVSALEWTNPELLRVTHIIHNAWPVDFSRNLSSFESHVAALVNLIKLALLASKNNLEPTRLVFASTIAVVGKHPLSIVPERHVYASCTASLGYAEAKWVCEQLIAVANQMYGPSGMRLFRGSVVRIGQMTGAEGVGAWNESEHFPRIVRASKMLGVLPTIKGTLSWMPVNRAANAVVELLFSGRFRGVYHLENPARQPWEGVLKNLSSILDLPLVPFDEWVQRAREQGERTPAGSILGFLEKNFAQLAAGGTVLETIEAQRDSQQMGMSTALERHHLVEYVKYWHLV